MRANQTSLRSEGVIDCISLKKGGSDVGITSVARMARLELAAS